MIRNHRRYSGGTAGRITPLGPYFVDANGAIVIRKSITAFTLPKRFATGRAADANAYLDWVASRGFNEVRVFSRVNWTGPPGAGVESGWQYDEAACTEVLTAAAARGLRVEIVAHTYSSGNAQEMADHLRRVDELCLAHENALLEVYNEPWQNGGYDLLSEILSIYTPHTPGWASGANPPPTSPTPGQSMTYHSPRKDEWPRCFKDAYEFSTGQGPNAPFAPGFPGAVMLDEPPQVEQTIRDYPYPAPEDWKAYAAGAAFFACGATMHSNPTLQKCEIPTDPTMLACIDAFIAGFLDVPLQRYHGYFHPDDQGSLRRYNRWGDDGKKYEISVRPYGFRQV